MRFPFFTSTPAAASGEKDENDSVRGDRSGAQCPVSGAKTTSIKYGRNPQILETIEKFLDVPFAHVPNVINPHNNMPVTDQIIRSHKSQSRVTSSGDHHPWMRIMQRVWIHHPVRSAGTLGVGRS